MALIGEQFDEAGEICGLAASIQPKQDKLSLRTRTKSNESVMMGIGKKWKELIDVTDKITFNNHMILEEAGLLSEDKIPLRDPREMQYGFFLELFGQFTQIAKNL